MNRRMNLVSRTNSTWPGARAAFAERAGRLVVFEGLDGTGKTTLSKALAADMGAVWTTTPGPEVRESGLRAMADARFTDPRARQLFYAASVVQESARIGGLLGGGQDVVVDRWWLTTWAYAVAAGQGLHLGEVEALVRAADVTIWVELDERERRSRLLARGMTADDRETLKPGRAARLRGLFEDGMRRAVAGRVVRLRVNGMSPEEAASIAKSAVAEVQTAA